MNFRGNHNLFAFGKILQRASEDLLARPLRVHVCGVEEVDARVDRVFDEGAALFLAERPHRMAPSGVSVGHATECDGRDVDAGAAQFYVIHSSISFTNAASKN